VAWLPQQRILFSGDLVEYGATPYAGDAYFTDWPTTLDNVAALGAEQVVPGRGAALTNAGMCAEGISGTRSFIADMFESVKAGVAKGHDLKRVHADTDALLRPKYGHWFIYEHCIPFDVSRAYDEATGHRDPRVWTASATRRCGNPWGPDDDHLDERRRGALRQRPGRAPHRRPGPADRRRALHRQPAS
jgi:hypothetical protein